MKIAEIIEAKKEKNYKYKNTPFCCLKKQHKIIESKSKEQMKNAFIKYPFYIMEDEMHPKFEWVKHTLVYIE